VAIPPRIARSSRHAPGESLAGAGVARSERLSAMPPTMTGRALRVGRRTVPTLRILRYVAAASMLRRT